MPDRVFDHRFPAVGAALPKVAIVGAGFVGRTTALRIAERGMADVCLIDVIEGWPQGLALDLRHSAPIQRFEVKVTGSNDLSEAAGSQVVVITAGAARGPGMSRLDLLNKNREIVEEIAAGVGKHCPEAVAIVVTNPLDEMTFLFSRASGLARHSVMGMAGILDSARLCAHIAEELKVSPLSVEAVTLGSHGDDMVPVASSAMVGGRPLSEIVDRATLQRLYQKTKNAGAEIVNLLGKGSAFYAPSAAAAKMANAVLSDTKEVLPVSAWVEGQYGISETYLGVPARLGRKGVEEVVEIPLDGEELAALQAAAEAIRSRCSSL